MASTTSHDNAAWKATDFRSPADYTRPLAPSHVAEIDDAIRAFTARGLSYEQTGRAEFPLPSVAGFLKNAYHEVKSGRGFVVVSGLPAERGAEWMRGAVWGLGTWFGEAVNQTIKGCWLTDVRSADRSEGNTRYYNTPHELELHIDPACDIVALACIRQAREGGGTSLASAVTVHDEIQRSRPDLLEILYRGFHLHRFGESWPDEGDITAARVPFFAMRDGKVSWRGFQKAMLAAHRELGLPLTPRETEAMATFNAIAKSPDNRLDLKLASGDVLITNNLAILHGRSGFAEETPVESRHLLRLWLAGRDFRPIPPEMNYFNRGACGMPLVPDKDNHYADVGAVKEEELSIAG